MKSQDTSDTCDFEDYVYELFDAFSFKKGSLIFFLLNVGWTQ